MRGFSLLVHYLISYTGTKPVRVFLHACACLAGSFTEGSQGKQPPGEVTGPLYPVTSRTWDMGLCEACGHQREVSAMTSRACAPVAMARTGRLAVDVLVPRAGTVPGV